MNEPLRYESLTTRQQRGLNREMRRVGENTATESQASIEKYQDYQRRNPASGPKGFYTQQASSREKSLTAVQPVIKNVPITVRSAAEARVALVQRAAGEAREHGAGLSGAGWYYTHHRDIMSGAQGIPASRAIPASTVLSPSKDPKAEEVPAAHALMQMHTSNPEVSVRTGKETSTRRWSDIATPEAAHLVSTASGEREDVAKGKKPSTWSESPAFAQAGLAHKRNTEKSIAILRGESAAITGPKVQAYTAATLHATPGEEVDYRGIAHHYAHSDPNQGMLQFSRSSAGDLPHTSLLSSEHATAEDTWMQGISSGQPMSFQPERGKIISPAKRVVDKGGPAEFPSKISKKATGVKDPNISRDDLVYAWGNKATRKASELLGPVTFNQHGENVHMPSVMVQEVAWTQGRREAGADAPHNKEVRERTGHRGSIVSNRPSQEERLF